MVGKASAFDAEQVDHRGRAAARPAGQGEGRPEGGAGLRRRARRRAAGETVEEDSEVAILVAVGNGNVTVPSVVGKTPGEAEKTLREAGLTLGAASPAPADPEGKIESQIPAEKEVVKEGAPVDIFMAKPKAAAGGRRRGRGAGGEEGGEEGGAGGGGGEGGGPVKVPEIAGASDQVYAQKVGDGELVPIVKRAFDESDKGTVFRVEPGAGHRGRAGQRGARSSSPPASPSSPSTTTRTCCWSTASRARTSTRSPRARRTRATRRGASTPVPRGLHLRRAGVRSAT